MNCTHNAMVPTCDHDFKDAGGASKFVWKCAHCGYIYGSKPKMVYIKRGSSITIPAILPFEVAAYFEQLPEYDASYRKRLAKAVMKSINRHVEKMHIFEGGRAFGVDWVTWNMCYPDLARGFNEAATVFAGREGRFMPRALLS